MEDSSVQQLFRSFYEPSTYINDFYQSLDVEVEFFLLNLHRFFSSKINKSQQGTLYIYLFIASPHSTLNSKL
jgi:hypothetical protein